MPGTPWEHIIEVALVAREVLEEHGLAAWPKTSGGRGFHVYARIERQWRFKQVRLAAETVAREVERRVPDIATARWWKEERHGVFVDFNQNAFDRTVASAWSVRPTHDARVSTPLAWDEVPGCRPEVFTLPAVLQRYAERGDPWEDIETAAGSLEGLLELADRLGPAEKAPKGTGRRTMTMPLLEIARAKSGGRGAGRPRPLARAAPGRRRPPGDRRRAGRPDAGQQLALVPDPGQPAARPRGAAAAAGGTRGRLRPVGGPELAGPAHSLTVRSRGRLGRMDPGTPRLMWHLFEPVHGVTYFAESPAGQPRTSA